MYLVKIFNVLLIKIQLSGVNLKEVFETSSQT